MALMDMTFRSQALGFDQSVCIFLPEPKDIGLAKLGRPYTENLPVLYLLHGYSDNHTAWLRRSNMERYLHHSSYNMICVCTSMRNFYYTDMAHGYRYYTYMSRELPNMIETMFRASSKREDRFIAGLSMGGYGALKIALSNPERYAAVGSFSGAVSLGGAGDKFDDERYAIFGTHEVGDTLGTPQDIRFLVEENLKNGVEMPQLYVSCGTADYLLERNRGFHRFLSDKGVAHTYYEQEGMAHEWAFWDSEGYKMVNEWLPVERG
jgi:putative tributyrin esterase